MMVDKKYPSDITREKFELIRADLESVKKRTSPRKYDLYDIFCAVLYILKEGCRWASLPREYPDYRRVYYYFSNWKNTGILDKVLKKIGWRHSYKQWSEKKNIFPYHRFAIGEKH